MSSSRDEQCGNSVAMIPVCSSTGTNAVELVLHQDQEDVSDLPPARKLSTKQSNILGVSGKVRGLVGLTGGGTVEPPRRSCSAWRSWWSSSAGGKSGVVSVALVVIIIVNAGVVAVLPIITDMLGGKIFGVPRASEIYFQYTRTVLVFGFLICVLLVIFGTSTLVRITCRHSKTLAVVKATAKEHWSSKYRVVRAVEALHLTIKPSSPVWAHVKLVQEIIETAYQLYTVAGYAHLGYSPAALYLYIAVIALNTAVWWMLALPRTIETVRWILMLNAGISAFYGLFPLIYFFIDGLGGIGFGWHGWTSEIPLNFRFAMLLNSIREALLGGGNFVQVAEKVLARLLFLFLSISAMQDLVELDFYLQDDNSMMDDHQKSGRFFDRNIGSKYDNDGERIATRDRSVDGERQVSSFTRLRKSVFKPSHERPGLTKWAVVPAIVGVLVIVLAMCGRLAALTTGCQYAHLDEGGNIDGDQSQQRQHWVGRWCLYQSFPLLTAMPGSPSSCACAVLFVRGPSAPSSNTQTSSSDWSRRGPCDQHALTQLHSDLVNEDLHIAKYLQSVVHFCPMQNRTQTEDILATKMESVTSIVTLRTGGTPPRETNMATTGAGTDSIALRGLRTPKLLSFWSENVPLVIPSDMSFKHCIELVQLWMRNAGLTAIPTGAFDYVVKLAQLYLENSQLEQIPSLENNTKLVRLNVADNRLQEIPNLENNGNLERLFLSSNRISSWPESLARITTQESPQPDGGPGKWARPGGVWGQLRQLSVAGNKLSTIPGWVTQLPNLKFFDVSDNNITSLETMALADVKGAVAAGTYHLETPTRSRNQTMLLLGRNPVCANGTDEVVRQLGSVDGSALGSKWFVSCGAQCSSSCARSIVWKPASIKDRRGDGFCDIGCNTTACSYDGGDCVP